VFGTTFGLTIQSMKSFLQWVTWLFFCGWSGQSVQMITFLHLAMKPTRYGVSSPYLCLTHMLRHIKCRFSQA
jgi:hypothetical protein